LQRNLRTLTLRVVAAALAITMFAGISPTPGLAAEEKLDRRDVIKRARKWADQGVPYSQKGYKDGYRRDCSGFVSYAWDLPENLVTWNIPTVAKRISKDNLKPGDVLLNAKGGRGGRHVVMFDGWANKKKTTYWAIEQTGQSGVRKTVRRKMPYPYKFDKSLYKPYRYVSMDGYYEAVPEKSHRQPVKGYDGRVETPEAAAAKKKAAAKKASAAKKAAEKKAAAAKDAAEVKAAAEKKAQDKRIAKAKAEQARKTAELRAAAEEAAAAKRAAAEQAAAKQAAEEAAYAEQVALTQPASVSEAVTSVALESARQIVDILMMSLQQGQTE
jgi:flagellar biosynthesis GTPase FlhF